jgi:glycosyltransferase involved in cell wall biosynthesis
LIASKRLTLEQVSLHLAGPIGEPTRRQAAANGLLSVATFYGDISRQKTYELQRSADVLLLLLFDVDGYEMYIPAKLYEYLAVRRPILAMLPGDGGETAEIIREKRAGLAVPVRDLTAIKNAINCLVDGETDFDSAADIMEFSAERICQQTVEVLNAVVDPCNSGP